jgi:hypothetical protein
MPQVAHNLILISPVAAVMMLFPIERVKGTRHVPLLVVYLEATILEIALPLCLELSTQCANTVQFCSLAILTNGIVVAFLAFSKARVAHKTTIHF